MRAPVKQQGTQLLEEFCLTTWGSMDNTHRDIQELFPSRKFNSTRSSLEIPSHRKLAVLEGSFCKHGDSAVLVQRAHFLLRSQACFSSESRSLLILTMQNTCCENRIGVTVGNNFLVPELFFLMGDQSLRLLRT